MRKIVLDTETTGIDPKLGHRIIEVAAIVLEGRKVTKQTFHRYLNPEREIDEGAAKVHGLTLDRLQNEPKFADIAPSFLAFIADAELIIHNAPFDIGFLNAELNKLALPVLTNPVIDTLKMAKELHPGKRNNLNALCERYQIDNSHRTLHGALLDTELLAEVYFAMTRGQDSLLGDDFMAAEAAAHAAQFSGDMNVRVLLATPDELALHQEQLDALDKASKSTCLWRQLET